MLYGSSTGMFALAAALMLGMGGARAADNAKYPNLKGQWDTVSPRLGGQSVKFDPYKKFGPAQEAPLTPEYQKIHEESMADQAKGGQGNFLDHARCLPGGMPSMMSVPTMEFIVTPDTTYIATGSSDLRRIFTDGRPWPDRSRADLSGLCDRQMDRPGRRGRLRRARGRDPRAVQGAARLRRHRTAAALRQRVDLQGADPSRQERSEPAA